MTHRRSALALISLLALGACAHEPILLDGLGDYRRPLTAKAEEARQWCDQGLVLAYGFNHDEAVRSFERASDLDPSCAFARFGLAWALGPNINGRLRDRKTARRAWLAAHEALELASRGGASDVELALTEALVQRYADPHPSDRKPLDQAWADAMARVWTRFPDDPDVGTLYADALLNLSPWNQWAPDGTPRPNTETLVAALERVLALDPRHPGANHLYIHAVEASSAPERGIPSAERLESLVPGIGHLRHMPGHIWIRTGHYARAARVSLDAVEADHAYFATGSPQGRYRIYHAHNLHFAAYAATCQGNREIALRSSRACLDYLGTGDLSTLPSFAQGFLPMPWHVMVRFGMWDEILAEPKPEARFDVATAFWHYARAIALANLDRLDEADAESALFDAHAATLDADRRHRRWKLSLLLGAAREMMRGEIHFKAGRSDDAFAALRRAIAHEDQITYGEPPGWIQPVRHALGALLLAAGRHDEAEAIYREDLTRLPENGWSLHGLAECLRARGATEEASAVEARFARAWADADIEIRASCFCR